MFPRINWRNIVAFLHDSIAAGRRVVPCLSLPSQLRARGAVRERNGVARAVGGTAARGTLPVARHVPGALALRQPSRPAPDPGRGSARGDGDRSRDRGLQAGLGTEIGDPPVPDPARGHHGRESRRLPRLEGRPSPAAHRRWRTARDHPRRRRRRGQPAQEPRSQPRVALRRAAGRRPSDPGSRDPGREGARRPGAAAGDRAAGTGRARRDRDARTLARGATPRRRSLPAGERTGDDGAFLRGPGDGQGHRLAAAARRARRPARPRSGRSSTARAWASGSAGARCSSPAPAARSARSSAGRS